MKLFVLCFVLFAGLLIVPEPTDSTETPDPTEATDPTVTTGTRETINPTATYTTESNFTGTEEPTGTNPTTTPESLESPEISVSEESRETSQSLESPETSSSAESPKSPETSKSLESSEASNSAESPESPETSNSAESLETPESAETTEPTESTESTTPGPFELPLAEECDEELCKLPDCRCSSTDIPGGLAANNTPQFVTITFDDGVNVVNIETYRSLVYDVINSNGCPAGVTFYVSHEYTNYVLVNELYNRGFEIALHSISHRTPQGYWMDADYDVIKEEIADQRTLVSQFANIPLDTIQGVRLPFLQMSGNASFHVMADFGLDYDCSWPTTAFTNPGLWPYSLDYATKQDCIVPPCPTASFPNTWVQPMVSWTDLNGFPCSMADGCFFTPPLDDEEAWYEFIVNNFNRHYSGNRAPFGYYVHEWYLAANPAVRAAFVRFIDLVSSLDDAFMVTASEVLEWVKNPIPVDEYRSRPCKIVRPRSCPARSCGPLSAQHTQMTYWMQVCNSCPRVYPWVGNPLGL